MKSDRRLSSKPKKKYIRHEDVKMYLPFTVKMKIDGSFSIELDEPLTTVHDFFMLNCSATLINELKNKIDDHVMFSIEEFNSNEIEDED